MKSKKQKVVLGSIFLVVLLGCLGIYITQQHPLKNEEKTVQILATSDTHGKFVPWNYASNEEELSGSLAQISSAVKEKRNDATLVVDAGDTIQDNSSELFLNDEQTHPMIAAMNAIGYDTWTIGNHEFNYGVPTLKKITAQQHAKVLCGNVYDSEGHALGDPYTIIEKDGIRIGIIGMCTPNITKWDAANLKDCKVTDPAEESKKAISAIKDKCDCIIGVMHMGTENEYNVANSGVKDLAQACPEFDVIVASHAHECIKEETINGVLIVENKSQGQTMSDISLTLTKDNGKWKVTKKTAESIDISKYQPDQQIIDLTKSYDEKAKQDANKVIGTLSGNNLAPAQEIKGIPQAQLQDSPLIDLINNVQLHYSGAKVSAAALFSPKANINEGPIKKCSIASIYKFSNTLYTLEMSGSQLKKYMEWSASYYNTLKPGDLTISFNENIRSYNYDMFQGVKYTIDVSKPEGSRITNLTWEDGTPIKDDEKFTIAVNNYRANSQLLAPGVIFNANDMPKLLQADVHGEIGSIRDLIADYIKNSPNQTITANCDNNWKLIGISWNPTEHEQVVKAVNEGKLSLPSSANGRTPNTKSLTENDLKNIS